MKEYFFNKPLLSDIRFKVKDQVILAHKVIVSSFCEVMSAMFSGHFAESSDECIEIENEQEAEAFLAYVGKQCCITMVVY